MTTSAGGRTRRSAGETRRAILEVAERLFVDEGYASVTMDAIARGAGVSRPVPYNHFESKEGVFLACVERARDDYHHDLAANVSAYESGADQLRAGATVYFSLLEKSPRRWRLLFGGSMMLPGEFNERLDALRWRTIETIAGHFRAAAPASGASEKQIDAFAHATAGVGERLGYWWLANRHISKDEVTEIYLDYVSKGLGTLLA